MMSSRLLHAGTSTQGFARRSINRGFERLRSAYARVLDATLAHARPSSTPSGSCSPLLAVPMYMLSPKELAPTEDQGVVFGVVDVPANATLEQLTPYTDAGRTRC